MIGARSRLDLSRRVPDGAASRRIVRLRPGGISPSGRACRESRM